MFVDPETIGQNQEGQQDETWWPDWSEISPRDWWLGKASEIDYSYIYITYHET